ncbi:MAG: YihY/virulence factor BrkB family protein [Candidatus Bathyarchaeota archaeon]|nr:YihY/virulence factor BrkB family protein [Candidatus Bathyarchaeota archaeon]
MNKQELYRIFKTAFIDWLDDNATLRAAALTYFIILPLPTLLLLVTAIFSLFLGEAQAAHILIQQIQAVVGPAVAELFNQLILNTGSPFTSVWTAFVVIAFSIGGAIGAFAVLRDTMDCIWEVHLPKGLPFWMRIRQKIVPFALVSSLGLIVIAWTALVGGILNTIILFSVNEVLTYIVLETAQVLLSFAVAVLLFAIIYRMIPEAKVHWRDVALAATVTGVAFTVTNYIFGAYIQTFVVTTVAGAAGALLIILLWVFVLNEIVLYGAEVSKVYATTVGTHSRQHLPEAVLKIIEPLQRVGEKIDEVVKEEVVKIEAPSKEPQIEAEVSGKRQQPQQPDAPPKGRVENAKIKPLRKKRKGEK